VVALHTMSALDLAFKDRNGACRRLTCALADILANPGDSDAAAAEVERAKTNGVTVTQGQLTDEWMQGFSVNAAALVERRKTQQPAISSILADVGKDRDFGCALGGGMDGLYGLWHRLWGSLTAL
jgi:hypothetical protein